MNRYTWARPWGPAIQYSIPALRKLRWKTTVLITPGDMGIGDEIRLPSGKLLGYLRHSPIHRVPYKMLPDLYWNGVYAVSPAGVCTKVYRDGKTSKADIQGALNELGEMIVAEKTRHRAVPVSSM